MRKSKFDFPSTNQNQESVQLLFAPSMSQTTTGDLGRTGCVCGGRGRDHLLHKSGISRQQISSVAQILNMNQQNPASIFNPRIIIPANHAKLPKPIRLSLLAAFIGTPPSVGTTSCLRVSRRSAWVPVGEVLLVLWKRFEGKPSKCKDTPKSIKNNVLTGGLKELKINQTTL